MWVLMTSMRLRLTTWIRIISQVLDHALVKWLPREPIRQNLPGSFKTITGNNK